MFPKWAYITFIINFFQGEKWHKNQLIKQAFILRAQCWDQPVVWAICCSSALLQSPAMQVSPGAEFVDGLWAVLGIWPDCQHILCPKKPSVRRGGTGSRAEAGPGALTGRFPRCRRHRRMPWQIPGAGHWSGEGEEQGWGFSPPHPCPGLPQKGHPQPCSGWCWPPGQCCGRCSRRQHPPGVPHTEWSRRRGRCSAGSSTTHPPAGRPSWGTVGSGGGEGWAWDQRQAGREAAIWSSGPSSGRCWWGRRLAGLDQIPTSSWPTRPWDLGNAFSLPHPSTPDLVGLSPSSLLSTGNAILPSLTWDLLGTTVHTAQLRSGSLTPVISFLLPVGSLNSFPYILPYWGYSWISGSQLGLVLLLRGYLTMSGDVVGCHNWGWRVLLAPNG